MLSCLSTTTDYPEVPPPSEEEQARQAVINNLWAAKEALDLAHQDFDDRENERAQEYEVNVQAADRDENTTDDSPEAFDVRWVVRFRDLTRALIEAEAVYADVKRKAFEAGCLCLSPTTSRSVRTWETIPGTRCRRSKN
jgi:hypothetical protein